MYLGRRRANSSATSTNFRSTLPLSPQSSLLSLKASLPWRNGGPPLLDKDPLLSFILSSPSFLDSTIEESSSPRPLYRIKTSGTTTTILRSESGNSTVMVASIRWPKKIPLKAHSESVMVLMKDGCWRSADTLLRHRPRENSHKFNIPHYNHSLKWKLHGSRYWCTTETVKGPIATLDPRKGIQPPRLFVYESLHDKHGTGELSSFEGVSTLLLDYLVTTALLLVVDLQEWMLVSKFEVSAGKTVYPVYSHQDPPNSAPVKTEASHSQWLNLMFGVPLVGRNKKHSLNRSQSEFVRPTSRIAGSSNLSSDNDSLFLPMQFTDSASGLESDFDDDVFLERPASPGAESHRFSLATCHSRTYFDPSVYCPESPSEEPALPSRPISYAYPFMGRGNRSQTSVSFHGGRESRLPPVPPLTGPRLRSPSISRSSGDGAKPIDDVPQLKSGLLTPPIEIDEAKEKPVLQAPKHAGIRPLPLPPGATAYRPPALNLKCAHTTNHISISSSHLHIHSTTLRSLPPTPEEGLFSPVSQMSFMDSSSVSESVSCPGPRGAYPWDAIKQRQPPETKKVSREELAQLLHALTPNSDERSNSAGTTVFEVPPPAYSSVSLSTRRGAVDRLPAPVGYPARMAISGR